MKYIFYINMYYCPPCSSIHICGYRWFQNCRWELLFDLFCH